MLVVESGFFLTFGSKLNMETIFPKRDPNFKIEFGKYKGKMIGEIYEVDPKYIYWLVEQDHYIRIDFHALLNIPKDSPNVESITRLK